MGRGGNRKFFEFMQKFGLENASIIEKYDTYIAKYYSKKLEAEIKDEPFLWRYPHGDFRDKIAFVAQTLDTMANKVGSTIADKWEKSGIEDKIKEIFGSNLES
jgi:hypothetical protein